MKNYDVVVENNGIEIERYTINANNLKEAVDAAVSKYEDAPVVEIDGHEISGKVLIAVSGEDGISETEI